MSNKVKLSTRIDALTGAIHGTLKVEEPTGRAMLKHDIGKLLKTDTGTFVEYENLNVTTPIDNDTFLKLKQFNAVKEI